MGLEVRKKGKVSILELSGNMTIGDLDVKLREEHKRLIEAGEQLFVLNLARVRFMDSAAIGETAACAKRANEHGGKIKLVTVPGGKPEQVLKISGLDRVFEMYPDEEEAIASFIR